MKPIEFKEQTAKLLPPYDMTDEDCGPLYVYKKGGHIMSCWKMSSRERLRALFYGKIWLYIRAKETHPPIKMVCDKSVFD